MNLRQIIKNALSEDVGSGDITTNSVVPKNLKVKAAIVACEEGVVCGLSVAKEVFKIFDKDVKFKIVAKDGQKVKEGKMLARIEGKARTILTCERVALNFLQRLSGIATLTNKFVQKAKPYGVKILDTRKTMPGLRFLEKYAVKVGGGTNHRFGLYDGILIKDNHIKIAGCAANAVRLAKKKYPHDRVEVEAQSLHEVKVAVGTRADIIMLDNMKPKDIRKALKMINGKYEVEISGGINLSNVLRAAKLKVDCISVGALTHSAEGLNISLDILDDRILKK